MGSLHRTDREQTQQKIESINIICEIAEDRIEWFAQTAGLDLQAAQAEHQKQMVLETTEHVPAPKAPIKESLERASREARALLELEITDARAIKNRL